MLHHYLYFGNVSATLTVNLGELRGSFCCVLAGDQVMCCRRSDFLAVTGFDPRLPIMVSEGALSHSEDCKILVSPWHGSDNLNKLCPFLRWFCLAHPIKGTP